MRFTRAQSLLAAAAILMIAAGLGWQKIFTHAPKGTSFDWTAQVSPWTAGGMDDPWGLARDAAGNIYVAEGGNANRIRRIAPDGSTIVVAGGREGFADGTGAAASFNTPSGIALDAQGNLYIADTGNHAIRKMTPQGEVTTLAGDGRPGAQDGSGRAARFNGPTGIALDAAGMVYVADTYNDSIRRIAPDGSVSTLAGGARPGWQDGQGREALFDTPAGLALLPDGSLAVADLKNAALRRIDMEGRVTTLAQSAKEDKDALLRRPASLAATADGHLYIADVARGRILQRAPDGRLRGLTGIGIDFQPGDTGKLRLDTPHVILLDADGALLVSDSARGAVRRIAPPAAAKSGTAIAAEKSMDAPAPALPARLPWPVNPNSDHHEIVGTMGEVRGEHDGDPRHHFHGGLDVQAALGATVHAITNEKVSALAPNWGEATLNEGMALDSMAYIHMKVGRTADERPLDPARFTVLAGEDGKPRVRVRRGTRFAAGDALGSVNRMYHVHLEYHPGGRHMNPLQLPLAGLGDRIAPVIEGMWLVDDKGQRLPADKRGTVTLQDRGALHIVADAWDRMDSTLARRRLGLYRLGYQLMRADGTPLPGFEQPRITQQYDRLPADREMVRVAYAENSGITVYGSKETRFLYEVTNTLQDGVARTGSLEVAGLAPGRYMLRVLAADYAGNQAMQGRDLEFVVR